MWRLQLKSQRIRDWLVWARLGGFSLLLHALFFFYLFCVHEHGAPIHVVARKTSSPVLFMPMQANRARTVATSRTAARSTTASPAVQKPAPKKVAAPKTVVAHAKPAAAPKKEEPKKKSPAASTKEEPIKKAVVPATVEKKMEVVAKAEQNIKPSDVLPQTSDELGMSMSDKRLEMLRYEIVSQWRRPVGVEEGVGCTVGFSIDRHGKPYDIQVIKPSGVLMYDISACSAVRAAQYDRWMYGKKTTIDFV